MKGPDAGVSSKLKPGVNLIGRGAKSLIPLTSPDISWEHLSITRNGDDCIVENLSASGTYIDDARIVAPVKLRPRDQLRLSKDTLIRFESDEAIAGGIFSGFLGTSFLVMLVIAIIAIVWAVLVHNAPDVNWVGAYNQLEPWVATEVKARRMPPDALELFREAWRLEQARDFVHSQPLWLRLNLLLDTLDTREAFDKLSVQHPRALAQMLTPLPNSPEPSDEELAAALSQFVNRRLDWSTLQVKAMK